ncbi:MAG: hypothetical protein IPM38_15840 [Ignavibacteria bacterium]|nr:hypothetical protein [Ignavibacteria bacterium]
MKKFIIRVTVFLTIPVFAGIIIFIAFSSIVSSVSKEYKLEPDISEIYIGDSHIQCSVNDSLISGSKNLRHTSESFYFSYYKLKLILEANPNIKKIYLGFSYHSLSDYYDDFITGKYSRSISPDYFFILPLSEQINFITRGAEDFPSYIKSILISGNENLSEGNIYTFAGRYLNRFKESSAAQFSMDKRLKFQYYKDKKLNEFSEINLRYLNEIIALCKRYNIDLILLNTPLHPYYRSKLPVEYINKYRSITERNDLKVIDLSSISLEDDCYIPDGDHVSEKGSLLMTKELIRIKN